VEEGIPQGLKPAAREEFGRPKAEALGYLEAKANANATATAQAQAQAKAKAKANTEILAAPE
jgi:hypothetical protein